MKKFMAFILATALVFSFVADSFAVQKEYRVFSDTTVVESGETVTVPIYIEGNAGFMGFSIVLEYDDTVFTPISVLSGELLSGTLNDSIDTASTNSFKVVYTGTQDIVGDGVLFSVTLKVSDIASGRYYLNLSYSNEDSFNEQWKDVSFNCEQINVVISENGTTLPEETTSEPETDFDETTTEKEETTADNNDLDITEKTLSERMREWVDGLPVPFNYLLAIFVIPIAFIISWFE